MTGPHWSPGEEPDPFAPPRPGSPPVPPRYPMPPRSRGLSIFLKVLAGLAVLTVLGFAAAAALFIWVMSSYGDNK